MSNEEVSDEAGLGLWEQMKAQAEAIAALAQGKESHYSAQTLCL